LQIVIKLKKLFLIISICLFIGNNLYANSSLSGYKHCKNVWGKLINIRDGYSKNSSDYYRLDALVQTAFDLWTAYKGTNAKDTGNCDRLLSLGNN
tara:strand:+ start:557 stop:841 length:285 start_codon:yes stop_codon:yes gene_type:complete